MKANRVFRASVHVILLAFFLLPVAAHAQPCTAFAGGVPYPSINAALSAIGTGPGFIFVTGTCSENVQINNARSITIFGFGGANVVEPTDLDAFDISQSQVITLENLDISSTGPDAAGVSIFEASDVHIVGCNIHNNQSVGVQVATSSVLDLQGTTIQYNTPFDGMDVYDNSTVNVRGSTIQYNGSLGTGGTAGVFASRNSVIVFGGQPNFIQYNADLGIEVRNLTNLILGGMGTSIQGNGTNGISVETGSHLQFSGRRNNFIQGNGTACPLDPTCGGIFATQNSTLSLGTATISGNQGSGVSARMGATVGTNGATISNNTGDGVHIEWDSIGSFLSAPGPTITGNGGKSVFCDTTSLAVGDLSGITNIGCSQIARSVGPPRPGRVMEPTR